MTKSEFMNQLEELLKDLPSEEKEAALTYYDDYFEDAGSENTDQVIEELGSPERVASTIKYNISETEWKDSDKMIYTENGFKDTTFEEDKFEVVSNGYEENKGQTEDSTYNKAINKDDIDKDDIDKDDTTHHNSKKVNENSNTTSKVILVILLCIIAIPVGIPVLGAAFGLIVGVLATAFGLFVALLAITAAFLLGGIVLFVAGVIQMFLTPLNGVLMCGIGLTLFGLGVLAAMLTFFICTKVLPSIVKGVVELCRLPFKKRGVTQ